MPGSSSRNLREAVDARLIAEDDEVDTVGGLAFMLAGRILQPGELVVHPSRLAARMRRCRRPQDPARPARTRPSLRSPTPKR